MNVIQIKKGKDIPLKGAAEKRIEEALLPEVVAVRPLDFCGLKARVLAKEGEQVQAGSPVLEDKNDPRIKVVAPAGGRVIAVRRGEKRKLLEIVIETEERQIFVQHAKFHNSKLIPHIRVYFTLNLHF